MIFRKLFGQKLKARETLLQNERALSIHEHPFINHHNGKNKGQVLIVSIVGRDEDLSMQQHGKPDLDKMAQQAKFIQVQKFL